VAVITPIGLDHAEFLGTDVAGIAMEKAGIIKPGVPVVIGAQEDLLREVIVRRADVLGAPVVAFGQDFFAHQEHGRMVYQDMAGLLDLPLPRLVGPHQIENAATAIAALRQSDWVKDTAIEKGLRKVEWPARMQRLSHGPLIDLAPKDAEVWLDGGHNPHGAGAIARTLADLEDRAEKPLYLISGMLANKDAVGFFSAFRGLVRHVVTVAIPEEEASLGAGALYDRVRAAGLEATPAENVEDAMLQVAAMARMDDEDTPPRILICGSLYLAGTILIENA